MVDWIEDIDRRANRATPGPWRSYVEGRDFWGGGCVIVTSGEDIELLLANDADLDFIAHARQDIPRLVDEIRHLRYSLSWARAPLSPLLAEYTDALIFYPCRTDYWIDDILARMELATPGPWHGEKIDLAGVDESNQNFILHAREDIPQLIVEIRRLQRLFHASATH